MISSKFTPDFFNYIYITHGIRYTETELLTAEEIQEYLLEYRESLEAIIYHYVMLINSSKKQPKEQKLSGKYVFEVIIEDYSVTVVKGTLSLNIYLQKNESEYKRPLKNYSIGRLEKVKFEVGKQIKIKIRENMIYQ